MRILLYLDYFQPQLGYSEYYVSTELQKQGHVIRIVTSDRYFPFPNYEKVMRKFLGERIQKTGLKKEKGLWVYRERACIEIFTRVVFGNHEKHLKEFRPDSVIVNGSATWNTIVLSFLKGKYGYRLITFDSHLPSELFRTNIFLKRIFYLLFRIACSNLINSAIDKCIAVQEDTALVMKRFYGIRKTITYIPLGTDTHIFYFSVKQRRVLREKYHLSNSNFVLLYTGKIIKEKKLELLFKAFNSMVKKHEDVRLVLVGKGSSDYLRACYRNIENKYRKNVIRIPFQPQSELYKYYSFADVGIWPFQESTSMIDAQASRLPIIINDAIGDKKRLLDSISFKKDNAIDLFNKIEYYYHHRKQLDRLALKACKNIRNAYSWETLSKRYID